MTLAVSEKLRRNYEEFYSDHDSDWRRIGALDKVNRIVSLTQDIKHDIVLEIGSGDGSILKRLSEVSFAEEMVSLEISESAVDLIQNLNIPFLKECQLFDGYHIPFPDNSFDLVILTHVIEHLEFPRQMINEAKRVARTVFVEVPLECNARSKNDFVFDSVGHINFYTPKTIRWLIQSCNLTVVNQIVANPMRSTYTYQYGKKGLLNYWIKEWSLKLFPRLSPMLWTYNASLLCEH